MHNESDRSTRGTEHLRHSEERFRLLVESVRDYAVFMLDPAGHVLTWNAGAERFRGYRADEIRGSHFSRFYPPEALARGLPAHELEAAAREGSFEDEGWRVRKDGSQFWPNVVITAMRDKDGTLVGYAERSARIAARRATRVKDEFLATLSHELRTPLSSTTRTYGGLGPGLAISKQLVGLHAGTIRVSSPGEGAGATFVVELPLSLVQAEEERAHPGIELEPTDTTPLPSLDGTHVFVADDEQDARELLTRVLSDQGATVTGFASADVALAALKTSRPSVIVSDIGMPSMDGYQLMRARRATETRDQRIRPWGSPPSRGPRIASARCSPASRRTWPSRSTSTNWRCWWRTWPDASLEVARRTAVR